MMILLLPCFQLTPSIAVESVVDNTCTDFYSSQQCINICYIHCSQWFGRILLEVFSCPFSDIWWIVVSIFRSNGQFLFHIMTSLSTLWKQVDLNSYPNWCFVQFLNSFYTTCDYLDGFLCNNFKLRFHFLTIIIISERCIL